MIKFKKGIVVYGEDNFHHFGKKDWLAETLIEGVLCRISWDEEGKVSVLTEYNHDITDRLIGVICDDAERLHDTEIEGYLTLKKDNKVLPEDFVAQVMKYNKEGVTKIISDGWLKIIFVATDVLTFLGESYLEVAYWTRKLKVEDVIIWIDNTFKMFYKDNYSLSYPVENTKDFFTNHVMKWNRGMIFKNIKSNYVCENDNDRQVVTFLSDEQID